MDYGIYTTQGKKTLLGNRATVNGRDAIAYVKNNKWYDAVYEPQAEAVDTEDTSHTEEPQG